jgi:hypothetical protein
VAADSALEVALRVAGSFDRLGIEYLVGGSLASSMHGEPRSTQDVDFVAALVDSKIKAWVELLADDFYVDSERVAQAVQEKKAFNIVHLGTMFKADIFVQANDLVSQVEMARREFHEFPDGRGLWVASAEDIIIQKLKWYRLGDEISDRQWRDVLAVLKVRRSDLDRGYLIETARALSIADLLEKAIDAADVNDG